MLDEIKQIKSGTRELRGFGGVMAGALAVVIAVVWHRCGRWTDACSVMAVAGGFLLAGGLLAPLVLWPLQKAWMILAVMLGFVMTRLILFALFYLVFTPIHGIAILTGKRFLDDRIDSSSPSYWHDCSSQQSHPNHCERQF